MGVKGWRAYASAKLIQNYIAKLLDARENNLIVIIVNSKENIPRDKFYARQTFNCGKQYLKKKNIRNFWKYVGAREIERKITAQCCLSRYFTIAQLRQ